MSPEVCPRWVLVWLFLGGRIGRCLNACRVFEHLGATPWEERARAELRASGETARKREPSTLTELTPQQLQIARLVREGASNKEAAAQLFISPRTVDHHLRNIFAKLGITSRAELLHIPGLDEPRSAPSRTSPGATPHQHP